MRKTLLSALLCIILFAAVSVVLPAQTSGEDLAVLNRMMRYKMDELIPLRFVNAVDAQPIEGARVAVAGIGTFTTDRHGIVTFPEQEDGFYTLEFSRTGFITSSIEFEVVLNNVFANHFSISPVIRGDYMRIVLTWGDRPRHLDLYLEREGGYTVSFFHQRSADRGLVTLDYYTHVGFGPQTITLRETDLRAIYRIYVLDWTNRNSPNSRALSRSGATIRVFSRTGLVRTFHVPANRPGVRWDAFSIVNGQIVGN